MINHTTPHNPDDLLTMEAVSAHLSVPMQTLYKWSRKGQPYFPTAVRLPNRTIRVRRRDLDTWLEGRAA